MQVKLRETEIQPAVTDMRRRENQHLFATEEEVRLINKLFLQGKYAC
jgi:hypothetical protein